MAKDCGRCDYALLCRATGMGQMSVSFFRCRGCSIWFVRINDPMGLFSSEPVESAEHCPRGWSVDYCPTCRRCDNCAAETQGCRVRGCSQKAIDLAWEAAMVYEERVRGMTKYPYP